MSTDDILVIKTNIFLKVDKYQELYEQIVEQRKTGVILLPPYCTPVIIPKDTEIKVEKNE